MFGKKPEGVQKKKTTSRGGIPAIFWMFLGSVFTLMIGVFLYLWQPFKSPTDSNTPPQDGVIADNSGSSQNTPNTNNQDSSEYEFYDLLPEQEVTPIPDSAITAGDAADVDNKRPDVTLQLPSETFEDDMTYGENDTYDGGPAVFTNNDIPTVAGSAPNTATSTQSGSNPVTDSTQATKTTDPIAEIIAVTTTAAKDAAKETIKKSVTNGKEKTYILQINSYDSAEKADERRAEVLLAGVDAQVIKNTSNGNALYQVISQQYDNKTAVFMAQQRLQTSGIDSFVVERSKN